MRRTDQASSVDESGSVDQPILCVRGVHAAYGTVKALHGVSFDVPQGSVVALLGANGAGKSTTLRVICGLQRATEGSVELRGRDIADLSPGGRVKAGLALVPEGRRIFASVTVEENLRIGAYTQRSSQRVEQLLADMYRQFPILSDRRAQPAGTMSGGEQQMLAIARGLMAEPAVLLLDEPSLGLAPLIVDEVLHVVQRLNAEGKTIVLVEQNAALALEAADHAVVLESGSVVLSGSVEQFVDNDSLRRAYLGY